MKIITQFSVVLLFFTLVFAPAMSMAASAPSSATMAEQTLGKKELKKEKFMLKKQEILEKKLGKIEKLLEKKAVKSLMKPKVTSDKWKPAVLLWGVALLLSILALIFSGGLVGLYWLFNILAYLAWLGGAIFWVWFLIEIFQ